jgi:hypothetical protein
MLIADLMRKTRRLAILDEPTNDLDIQSLKCWSPGALKVMVTHDRFPARSRVQLSVGARRQREARVPTRSPTHAQWGGLRQTARGTTPEVPPWRELTGEERSAPTKIHGKVCRRRTARTGMADKLAAAEAAVAAIDARLNDPAVTGDGDAQQAPVPIWQRPSRGRRGLCSLAGARRAKSGLNSSL